MNYYIACANPNGGPMFLVGKACDESNFANSIRGKGDPTTIRRLTMRERYSLAGNLYVDLLPGTRAENGMIV
jgi:hypothetical protein